MPTYAAVGEDEVMRLVRTGITYTEVSMMLRVPDTRVARIARRNGYRTTDRPRFGWGTEIGERPSDIPMADEAEPALNREEADRHE